MPRNRALAGAGGQVSAGMFRFICGLVAMIAAGAALAAEPSCPGAAPRRVALPATAAALFHERPITIVAIGSSSTAGSGATAPDRTYPARLAEMLATAWPHATVKVLNRGVGGQMLDAVMNRLDADVLAAGPTLVIWQTGTNEAIRGMDETLFSEMLDEGVRRILATGADIVLMDSQIAARVPEDRVAVFDALLEKEARDRHVSLFSRTALMREWSAGDPSGGAMIGADGLHHTDRGYACVAESLGQAIIDSAAKGVPLASVRKK